jgi:16S rRNA (cytosine967-C5)-methyltransferase
LEKNLDKRKFQKPKTKNQNRTVSPARLAAFEVLARVEREKAFSSALLPIYEENLAPNDRALCHQLALGVLRNQIYLDRIIEKLTAKKIEKFDLAVALALRLGLYQLLFLDKIPAYSAINESVNLVQLAKKTSAKNLVNAVLRRATREKIELEYADEVEKISVETSHPRWLVEKWIGQFGFEETEKLACANNETPRLAFRLTEKFQRGDDGTHRIFEKCEFVENCLIAEKIDANLLELAENGEIYFQDEGSQMVAGLVEIKENEKFLDVCAAPGSKATFVASKEANVKGQNLFVAGDFYGHRIRTLRENCRRQGVDFVKIVQYDAEVSLPFAENAFDWILVDAPCSGTGTIRHNPEIKYFLQPEDFIGLQEKQLVILKNASKLVKAGGRLIYSTCSLEREENESIVEKFLSENSEFEKIAPHLAERFLTVDDFARTFPQKDETDGFFIAAFEKRH